MENVRIGVYICWCGTNIAKVVDVEKVAEDIGKLEHVVVSRNYKYMCSDPGQDLIIKDIKDQKLNRVVVAACSPRIHEMTFRKALEKASLNQYLFEMANIREQNSWVHTDREKATEKAIALVKSAINKVVLNEALEKREVDINPATLIIGGGIAGITAALNIADAGKLVYLIEKKKNLGGNLAKVDLLFPSMMNSSQLLAPKLKRLLTHPNIQVFIDALIESVSGYIGNFESIIYNGVEQKIEFGNILVATGNKTFDPSVIPEYSYGKLKDVKTSIEFEKILLSGQIHNSKGDVPKHIAIIHCVGSRNERYNSYCSRTCCGIALKYAHQLSAAIPDAQIYNLYADMRTFGKGCEEMYKASSGKNITFLMFDQGRDLPQIRKADTDENIEMLIEFNERLSGERVEVPADLVILMVGMEAQADAKDIGRTVGISADKNHYFIEKHPKLDPVATTTDGVFIIGSCQGSKGIIDTVSQARAAASRVLASISCGSVSVEVTTSFVNEEICCGCQTCITVCPYGAISYREEDNISNVNEVLCKGCGTCTTACPTGAIRSSHFTDKQILSQIEGIIN